jgi:branched-chain amino acid transport system ATP-binding protein
MSLLECQEVTRTFGALVAVDRVSLTVEEGEVVAVIGPNGAGKSTLFNMIAGLLPPTGGTIRFQGRPITGLPAHRICRLGIVKTFQIPQPLLGLRAWENVAVGAMYGRGLGVREARAEAIRCLELVGLAKPDRPAASLTTAERRRLDLARALATGARLILLDENLAGLTVAEGVEMVEVLRQVRARGRTLLLIEHVMRTVVTLAERVVVLTYGRKLADGPPAQVMRDEQVVKAYLGEAFA